MVSNIANVLCRYMSFMDVAGVGPFLPISVTREERKNFVFTKREDNGISTHLNLNVNQNSPEKGPYQRSVLGLRSIFDTFIDSVFAFAYSNSVSPYILHNPQILSPGKSYCRFH